MTIRDCRLKWQSINCSFLTFLFIDCETGNYSGNSSPFNYLFITFLFIHYGTTYSGSTPFQFNWFFLILIQQLATADVFPVMERNDNSKYVCSRRLHVHSMTTRPQCQDYSTASKWPGILKLLLKSVKNFFKKLNSKIL